MPGAPVAASARGLALFRHVPDFYRNPVADSGGAAQFGFSPGDLPALQPRHQKFGQGRLRPQFDPFPAFGVRFGVAGLAFLFLIDGSLCRPELPLQVRRPGFEAVQFGAGFVGKAFDSGQFRHALALAGLAFAQFAKATLGFSHGKDSAIFDSISNNIADK